MTDTQRVIPIAVFASGSGSNFKAIHTAIKNGEINGRITLVLSNNPKCGAIIFAEAEGIETSILNGKRYPTQEVYNQALTDLLKQYDVELILLAGYMKMIPDIIVDLFDKRIMNIHPALLPQFGGKGYYGLNVHQAVIKAGKRETGATVHFVNKIYDQGPILIQRRVEVLENDTAESLSARVLKEEHEIFPEAVKAFCEGHIRWIDNKPIIERNK